MGAKPAWFTLALSLPEVDEVWLEEFSNGLFKLAAQHGVSLIGGDTTRSETLAITIQIAGLLPRGQALRRHVLRNAMIPLVTVMGLQFANLLAGTIVVENVFALPGIGRLILQSVSNRDLTVVRDVVMLLAALVVLVNLAVDLLYALIDPRLRSADV